MQYLTIWDLILTPIYLVVLTAIAVKQRDKRYPIGHPLRCYFMPGLFVKFGGAIFIALIYQFYYNGGGDTFNYFLHTKVVNTALEDSLFTWFKLVINIPLKSDRSLYPYIAQMWWYDNPKEYTVSAIGAVFGVMNGTSYIPISLLFAYFSFSGVWAMYRTFVNIYPNLHKPLAIAFLFIPSVFVWGSAMFKDTICMFGLGWMTYTTFRIFVNRDFTFKNLFLLAFSFYLIALVKLYILVAFIPALGLWLLMTYSKKIKTIGTRWTINIFFIGFLITSFIFFSQYFAKELNDYSLENIAETANATRGWITYVSEIQGGSAYDLGKIDPTPLGMLSKFPAAVTVTLFRPFLWEAGKPIIMLSALEALAYLYFFLAIFFKHGIIKVFYTILRDPNLIFFLVFSLIFAFAVGLSTGNFGTLSRYKIPCLPFFAALLLILYYSKPILSKNLHTHAPPTGRKVHHLT